MERKTLIIITVIIVVLLYGIIAVGESLFDNPDYKKAKELNRMAEKAFSEGEYDKAYEYAEEAKQYIEKADAYANMLVLKHRANTMMVKASKRITYAKSEGVGTNFPQQFQSALSDYEKAKDTYGSERYESSITYSEKVIMSLENVLPKAPLPKYYKVRLIPKKRDCFWRISEYDFIYNDPWKWEIIYDANKEKLKNPDNPHFIFPGQLFVIPSINGEIREGTYDPKKKYM